MNPVTAIGVAGVAIVSITSHEAAHGFVADRLGDPTARDQGRLTTIRFIGFPRALAG